MKLNILSKPAAQQPKEILRYDYNVIADEDDRNAVMGAALVIKPMMRRAAEDLVKIGQELIAVKDMLPHGEFTPWLETEFNLNARTARRMMAVAERIGHKLDTLSDLSASVLYELAAESTPDEAIRRVGMLAASGEKLTVQDVRGVVASTPTAPANGRVVYMQPQADQPAQPEPEAPTQADRTLTVEQTVDMIRKAINEHDGTPEMLTGNGAAWAIYLADTYGFWPTIDVTKKAIAQVARRPNGSPATRRNVLDALNYINETADVMTADTGWLVDYVISHLKKNHLTVDAPGMVKEEIAYWREQKNEELRWQRRPLDETETQAVIARYIERKFDNDVDRLAFLDKSGPDAYVEAVRADKFINSATFEQARAAIRKEVAPRAAKEAAKRQEDERQKAVQSDKHVMLAALSRALAELPEGAEDTYYDLTGTTHYSAARQSLLKAIKELENTTEAKKVV